MTKLIVRVFLIIAILIACVGCNVSTDGNDFENGGETPMGIESIRGFIHDYVEIDRELTVDDFDFLRQGMSLQDVIDVVGNVSGYMGSGIITPFFELDVGVLLLQFEPITDHSYKNLDRGLIVYWNNTTCTLVLE